MPARKKPSEARQDKRPARVRSLELVPKPKAPPPPAGIQAKAKRIWADFWAADVAQAVSVPGDLGRLHRWIWLWDEWLRMKKIADEQPFVIGSTGQPVISPATKRMEKIEEQLARAETEFGLTPLARLKLGLTAAQGELTVAQLNAISKGGDEPGGSGDIEAFGAEFEEA